MHPGIAAVGHLQWIIWPVLASIGLLGGLAVVSPKGFTTVANYGGRWIDTSKMLAFLDRPIEIDRHVLPYCRILGVAVLISVAFLGYLYYSWLIRG